MTKAPHVERMEAELSELESRHTKLFEFIRRSDIFAGLDRLDQELLSAQEAAMGTYARILSIRIDRA